MAQPQFIKMVLLSSKVGSMESQFTADASVTELTLREPKVKDQLEVERIASIGRREAALFARLCDVDVRVIEELCIGDYKKLQEAYSDFLS